MRASRGGVRPISARDARGAPRDQCARPARVKYYNCRLGDRDRYDFGWIDCPVFDERGLPMQQRGVTATAGVFFLGLPRMYKVKSAFLWGVGEDAEFLAQQIEHRSDVS